MVKNFKNVMILLTTCQCQAKLIGVRNMQYLQEVTKWDTAALGHKVPNHTYMLDNRQWCVGYIKEGTTEEIIFSKPLKQFSKSYRKFKTL